MHHRLMCTIWLLLSAPSFVVATEADFELPNKIYILPSSIPMWPPAWWTWLIPGIGVIIVTTIAMYIYKRYSKNIYRREALQLLEDSNALDDTELLILCHQVIRRCLVTENLHKLAALPNQTLFNELDKQNKTKMKFSGLSSKFINGAYQPKLNLKAVERQAIITTTKHWCRRHSA